MCESQDSATCTEDATKDKRKRMSCGLLIECPGSIGEALKEASDNGYHFIVTHFIHPRYERNMLAKNPPLAISRTDRALTGSDWNRLIVGKLKRASTLFLCYIYGII